MLNRLIPALALAAMTASVSPALAANPSTTVLYADLDLETPAGQKTLEARIRNVASRICQDELRTGTRLSSTACREDIRKQVLARINMARNEIGKGG